MFFEHADRSANGAGLGGRRLVVSYPSDCRPVPVPYHPVHVHMFSGDSVGGGGDSPAKPPHRDKEHSRDVLFGAFGG